MTKKLRTYEADDMVVVYDAARCIHVKECVHRLPGVFDPEKKPWVDPKRASADAIAEVVRRCPTGALHYQRRRGLQEEPPERNEVRPAVDGPLYVRGRLELHLPDGQTIEETRAALCRCGLSENKPFCDDSHDEAGFRDSATNVPQQLTAATAENETVVVTFAPGGPILLDGPVTIFGADGSQADGVKGALCRCGESRVKPYCDGSHAASDIQTAQ